MHLEEITVDEKGTKALQSPKPNNKKLEIDTLDLGKQ